VDLKVPPPLCRRGQSAKFKAPRFVSNAPWHARGESPPPSSTWRDEAPRPSLRVGPAPIGAPGGLASVLGIPSVI